MTLKLSRRRSNPLAATTIGATAMSGNLHGGAVAATTEINVLNWKGYGTDGAFAVKEFAAQTGVAVKHDYYNSEPEMLTKLRTNPGAYDVVLINSARDSQAQAEGLIDAIDHSKVPNAAGLAPEFKSHRNINIGGKTYGVPSVWAITPL